MTYYTLLLYIIRRLINYLYEIIVHYSFFYWLQSNKMTIETITTPHPNVFITKPFTQRYEIPVLIF